MPKQRQTIAMAGCLLALFLLLWVLAIPLAALPAPIGPAADQFAQGAQTTVELTLWSGAAGLVLGVLAGVGKLSRLSALRAAATFYVWIIRGTPLLTQILFVYLALPVMFPSLKLSEFWSAVIALSLNVGAYNAEVIRSGVLNVPRGQTQAAQSLGLTPRQSFFGVVLPQAMRFAVPPLANNVVALLKDSSLAYAIGVVELNMIAQRVQAESFQPVPVFLTVAVIYLLLTSAFTQFSGALESRMQMSRA
jgi:polar amino acid transport system permease protein